VTYTSPRVATIRERMEALIHQLPRGVSLEEVDDLLHVIYSRHSIAGCLAAALGAALPARRPEGGR